MQRFSAYSMYLFYTAIGSFCFSLMSTATVLYFIEAIHMNSFQLLMVGFVLEITVFLFEVPTGILADLYSRRLSMAIGIMLTGCGFLLTSLMPSFPAILIAQVLWGIGHTFQSGADQAWIADELASNRLDAIFLRGTQVGQLATLAGIGASILFGQISLSLPIAIAGILLILTSLFIQGWFPETGFQPETNSQVALWQRMTGTLKEGIQVIRGDALLITIILIGLFMGLYAEGFDRLWQKHLLQTFKLPAIGDGGNILWFGGLNACALLFNILVVEWIRRHLQRTGKQTKVWILLMIHLLLTVTILVFAWTVHLGIALAAYSITFLLRQLNVPLYTAWINESIHTSHLRATIFSMQGQVQSLGEVLGGPLVMLVLFIWKSTDVAGLITSALLLLPICLLLLFTLRPGSKEGTIVRTKDD